MARGIMGKMMDFFGFEEEKDETVENLEQEEYQEEQLLPARRGRGQVVSLHAQRQVRVVVAEPRVYDDVQTLADHLKNRRPVIVNLEKADPEMGRRVIDFLSGAIYALNGSLQKVGSGIFLCVPSNMDITSEIRDQIKEKTGLPWLGR